MASYYDQVNGLAPKIWYRFNETAGTPTNSGSLSTTSTFNNLLQNEATDVDGRAVYFNGTSSNIILPSHPAFSIFDDRSFTIECWVKASQTDVSSIFQPILFNAYGGASNRFVSLELAGSARSGTPGRVVWTATNGSGNTTTIISPTRVDDNNWHHIVAVHNTTSMKVYIDGQLSISGTPLGSNNFDIDIQTNKKVIGQAFGANGTNYKGRMDEFAVYDYELSAQQVLNNYNAGAFVNFADIPGIASALAVQPTLIIDGVYNAAPMTADSLFVNTQPSTVDFPKMLEAYLSEFSLEQWYKFDNPGIVTNYGTGGIVGSSMNYNGTISNVMHGGIQGSGALKVTNGPAYLIQAFGANEPYSTEVTDHEFALGFWVKADTNYNNRTIFRYYNAFDTANHYYDILIGTGGTITFRSKGTQEANVTYGTAIDDNAWHFVYVEASAANNLIRISVDNSAFTTATTVAANRPTGINAFNIGNTNTSTNGELLLSHYFIGAYGLMNSTARGNVLTYEDTVIQGSARMPEPVIKFSNKFNDLVASYNPKIEFRLDEASGLPFNFGQTGISISKIGTNVTYLEPTQNRFAYKFTNADTYIQGDYTYPSGTFSTGNKQTMLAVFKTSTARAYEQIIGSMGMFGFLGAGITLAITTSGHLTARVNRGFGPTDTETVNYNTNVCDNKWHFAAVVRDGSNLTLYVDGKQRAQKTNCVITLSDSATYGISAEAKFNSQGAAAKDLWIDEFAVLADEFSAQEVFELWQSLNIDGAMLVSTATLPMPTNIAGTGATHSAEPHLATADLVMPGQSDEINLFSDSLNAHSTFIHPNYVATSVIDSNYGAVAMTADALFHDPQIQVGEFIGVDHMNASALFVHPIAIGGGTITAPTAVALDATFVMPGIITIKGAQHFADPMRSQAIFPLPPAYIQLSDDEWFVRLLEGHADKKEEFLQQQVPSGTISVTDVIKGGFLSFFDDVLTDLTTTTSPNSISSEIPAHYFDRIGLQRYDSNGNIFPLDTSKAAARVTPSRGSLTPSPMVSKGYFDDQERRAVRVENIEIPLPGTNPEYSIRPYHLEFSFKTTKSNQVIAYGQYQSSLYTNSRTAGAIGLYNGKIYLAQSFYTPVSAFNEAGLKSLRIAGTVPHPANFTDVTYVNHMLGNKRVDDGQWHHIVIQKGFTDGRTQIWIDGVLDKQLGVQSNDGRSTGYANIPGSDGSQGVRPYVIGFNSSDVNLYSDFQTSGWNYYPGRFLEEREITLNYSAFRKFKPIKAEPMTATIKATDNNRGAGNKARALLLYWWPVTRQFGPSESIVSNDRGQFGEDDVPTFDTSLYTYDYVDQQPQDYYGWDIFPLSITGYKGMLGGDPFEFLKPGVLQSNGLYIDSLTSAPRYLDVVNDIDLTQFDAIFFRNYPDQSQELDAYIREQFADQYFGVKEKDLYDNFIKSLRAAIDTGVSLFITNTQLALDLGIIDKYEVVPDFNEGDGDTYGLSLLPVSADGLPDKGVFKDVHRNNRLRVVNTIDGLTNESGYIWKDWVYFYGGTEEDPFSGEPNRPFISLENRPNGLQVGDTFVISTGHYLKTAYDAVPFENVKAGKVITAFANTIRQGNIEINNPYKNYATSIAVEPGTFLKGKPVGGKIFVNFTERLDGTISSISGRALSSRSQYSARDNFAVDLIQDEWINLAYNEGEISLATRNELLAAPYNLDRRLEAEIAGLNRPNIIADIQKEKTWDSNGMYILTNRNQLNDPTGSGVEKDGLGKGIRRNVVNKVKKSGDPGTTRVTTSMQWFSFEYSYQYPRAMVSVISMLTRGFRWLSNKVVDQGLVNRVEVMTAIATGMPMPVITGDKPALINAAAMVANARIVHAPGYALADVSNTTLPLIATARFGDFVKNIKPDVFTASAAARQPRISGIEEDEVVVYMIHVDPILYLREDIIK